MERVSKNCYKDKLITDPKEILRMARDGQSFYTPRWGVKPAAILMSMHFSLIMGMAANGLIWTIKKEK